jgi:hypothetical protein
VGVSRAVLQREAGLAQGRVDPDRPLGGETVAIQDQVESSLVAHDVQPLPQAVLGRDFQSPMFPGDKNAPTPRADFQTAKPQQLPVGEGFPNAMFRHPHLVSR